MHILVKFATGESTRVDHVNLFVGDIADHPK